MNECDLSLIGERASAFDRTEIVGLALKKRRPYGRNHTTWISASMSLIQYRAIGWVGMRLFTVIFEIRNDKEGEYYHLVTLWKATKEEMKLYEENS